MTTRPRPARIGDVARAAGVSVPTVSRVLTGAAPVSSERRRRVLRAIDELDFRPSGTARALATGRRDLVAVVTSSPAIHGYSQTLQGIETAARAGGYSVVISVVESTDPAEIDRAVQLMSELPLAGALVLKFDRVGVAALERFPSAVPLVAVSGLVDGAHPQAVLDEERAGAALTRHLLELGHRTVHHVAVPPSRAEDGRTTGWREELLRAGAPVPPVVTAASFDAAAGVDIGRVLALDDAVTAVFCGNDEVAMGVMSGAGDAGRRVPEDLSVVGMDDHPMAGVWRPGLATARQDFPDLGRRAFSLLEARIGGDEAATLSTVDAQVVVRASTAPPRR